MHNSTKQKSPIEFYYSSKNNDPERKYIVFFFLFAKYKMSALDHEWNNFANIVLHLTSIKLKQL